MKIDMKTDMKIDMKIDLRFDYLQNDLNILTQAKIFEYFDLKFDSQII